jgi:hypothetical protein
MRLAPGIANTLEKLAWTFHPGDSRTFIESCRQFGARFTLPSPGEAPFHLDFAPLGFVEFSKGRVRICDTARTCWSELDVCWRGDTAVSVFVEDDRVEVFADDRYSLCARLPRADQALKVAWSAAGPSARPHDIRTTLLQSKQKRT